MTEREHEATDVGCFLQVLAYIILSIFGMGVVAGVVLIIVIY